MFSNAIWNRRLWIQPVPVLLGHEPRVLIRPVKWKDGLDDVGAT